MKHKTKLKLAAVHQLCDVTDQSTEYMFQLMQDTCNVNIDTCINYMGLGVDTHKVLFDEINSLTEVMIKLGS